MRLLLTEPGKTVKDTDAPFRSMLLLAQAFCTVVTMLSVSSGPSEPQPSQAPSSYEHGPCPRDYRAAGEDNSQDNTFSP